MRISVLIVTLFYMQWTFAQHACLTGKVTYLSTQIAVEGVKVSIPQTPFACKTNANGYYRLDSIPFGVYEVWFSMDGIRPVIIKIKLDKPLEKLDAELVQMSTSLAEVKVTADATKSNPGNRLNSVEGFAIYEGKKTELVVIKDLNANLSTNNPRQAFGKITGLNIWESDAAGLQLGIGGRGLSPNRTSNFNTRQNGYDISADALGYPESYYTPPMEALERIEVVRGAASLQYGTQFGGMVNFVFKQGPKSKPIEVQSIQTLGSYGYFGSFNSLGGTVAQNKLNYYACFSHKQGTGWRPNSGFGMNTVYASIKYKVSHRLECVADYTFMQYDAQQPGGLTDAQFANNPRQSFRSRNWFSVNWNLFALSINYQLSDQTKINVRNFGLLSYRNSLGNLERINVIDLGGNRTFIRSDFENIGNETRVIHQYHLLGKPSTFLGGFRLYRGQTRTRQGDGTDGSDANYLFLNPTDLEGSDYKFMNYNAALFAEHIFRVGKKWSITPGIRYEYITTQSQGYYKIRTTDFAGNIVADTNIDDANRRTRSFILAGVGISYKINAFWECYGNWSQNYRAVNFNDIRINNPNLIIDQNITDERGFTADLGIRGKWKRYFTFDFTMFYLSYANRIGQILRADQPPLFQDYRFRTNIADSRNAGVECFAETDLWKIWGPEQSEKSLTLFTNMAYVDARYIRAEEKAIENNRVELAPEWMIRAGIAFKFRSFSVSVQGNYISRQYTDATNAIRVAGAVNGIIPAYQVMDITARYVYRKLTLQASCNNLLNQMYFTRRADSYPGPGIIPADAIQFFMSLGIKI